MKLKEGQKLRVKEFDKRPNYWNSSGKMDKWMGKIATLKYANNECLVIYEDEGEWSWKKSDFQIVFNTWRDVRDAMDTECKELDYYGCKKCKLKTEFETTGCYSNIYDEKNYKQLAENFEKMFGMECYVLEDENMENKFNKADLEDGMVVEYRNGERAMKIGSCLKDFDNGYCLLSSYGDNLTNLCNNNFDIIKVYDDRDNWGTILDMFNYSKNLIYQAKTMDVSLEEINALLKEKYPNIEKFNLPIDK